MILLSLSVLSFCSCTGCNSSEDIGATEHELPKKTWPAKRDPQLLLFAICRLASFSSANCSDDSWFCSLSALFSLPRVAHFTTWILVILDAVVLLLDLLAIWNYGEPCSLQSIFWDYGNSWLYCRSYVVDEWSRMEQGYGCSSLTTFHKDSYCVEQPGS